MTSAEAKAATSRQALTDPNIFYAGSQGALLTRYDRRTGFTRDIEVSPRFFSGEASETLPDRWQWTFPIVFSPFRSEHDVHVFPVPLQNN